MDRRSFPRARDVGRTSHQHQNGYEGRGSIVDAAVNELESFSEENFRKPRRSSTDDKFRPGRSREPSDHFCQNFDNVSPEHFVPAHKDGFGHHEYSAANNIDNNAYLRDAHDLSTAGNWTTAEPGNYPVMPSHAPYHDPFLPCSSPSSPQSVYVRTSELHNNLHHPDSSYFSPVCPFREPQSPHMLPQPHPANSVLEKQPMDHLTDLVLEIFLTFLLSTSNDHHVPPTQEYRPSPNHTAEDQNQPVCRYPDYYRYQELPTVIPQTDQVLFQDGFVGDFSGAISSRWPLQTSVTALGPTAEKSTTSKSRQIRRKGREDRKGVHDAQTTKPITVPASSLIEVPVTEYKSDVSIDIPRVQEPPLTLHAEVPHILSILRKARHSEDRRSSRDRNKRRNIADPTAVTNGQVNKKPRTVNAPSKTQPRADDRSDFVASRIETTVLNTPDSEKFSESSTASRKGNKEIQTVDSSQGPGKYTKDGQKTHNSLQAAMTEDLIDVAEGLNTKSMVLNAERLAMIAKRLSSTARFVNKENRTSIFIHAQANECFLFTS